MKELIEQYVGRQAIIRLGGFSVGVRILDVKQSWGKLRFRVSPLSGGGENWIENVSLIEELKS